MDMNWVNKEQIRYRKSTKDIILHSKITVLRLHRLLQECLDDYGGNEDELCIVDENISIRLTDHMIELVNNWKVLNLEKLYKGSIKQQGVWITPPLI
jgi:hypothetical protein